METDGRDEQQTAIHGEPEGTVEALREALCQPGLEFSAEAVEFAMARPAVACKVARGILEEALVEARAGRQDTLAFGPVYAAELLGYHHDGGAFDLLAEIAQLPGDGAYDILGDAITVDMSTILWSVCGGSSERLLSLADHPATNTFWRSAAFTAITIGVYEGVLDREEMLQVLRGRLEGIVETDQPRTVALIETTSWLVETIVSMGVGDDPSLLDRAYKVGLIDGGIIGPEIWHEQAPGTNEEALEFIRRRDSWRYPVDPMRLRKWACFSQPRPVDSAVHQKKQAKAKKRDKGRARSKASRKSRKKNRKKKR